MARADGICGQCPEKTRPEHPERVFFLWRGAAFSRNRRGIATISGGKMTSAKRLRPFLAATALLCLATAARAEDRPATTVQPATTGAAATAATATATATRPPAPGALRPAEDFAVLPFLERPTLSPDGTQFAALASVNGEQKLVIMRIGAGAEGARVLGLGENDLNWWSWVNNDWLVAGLGAVSTLNGGEWYLRRVVSVKADGSKLLMLGKDIAAQNADDVIWIARDGSPRILLSLQTSIYTDEPGFWPTVKEVNVSSGQMRPVLMPRENVWSWYADATGAVRMGVGYNDQARTSSLLYRSGGKDSFRTVDRADRRKGEGLTVPAIFLADQGKAMAIDDSDGYDALYDMDLGAMKLGAKVFGVPGYDIDSVLTDASGTRLTGVRYTDDRARIHWVDPDLAQVQADIDKAVGNRRADIVSTSQDQQVLIVRVGGADRPGAYYYFNRAAGVMSLLARVNDQIGLGHLAPVRTIHYKARDGLDIAAVLTLPEGRDPKSLPLILLPHGGPFARDEEEWDWWTQFLANRGYAVLQPNYRGSSGYGSEFAKKGEGQWGLAMQDDLNDAVDWAVKEGMADPKRVCIVGGSYGGYAAMRGAQRDGARYRCAISYAGVSDLAAMMRYDGRFLDHGGRNDWMKKQAPDFAAVSPINFAEQFSTPILIMHGRKDRVVQVKQSREMVEMLKKAGKPYIYIEQPLGDHHFSRQEDRLQFLKEMEAFLAKYNPA